MKIRIKITTDKGHSYGCEREIADVEAASFKYPSPPDSDGHSDMGLRFALICYEENLQRNRVLRDAFASDMAFALAHIFGS